jgi:TPR repeat protein/serine/threonine protein kinase
VDPVELLSEGLPSALRAELQSYLRAFEASWDEAILGQRLRALPPEPLRQPALWGMIAIDLLCRRRSGHRVSIRSYLKKIPEMGSPDDVPARLLLVEYIARREMGEDVAPEDFTERFPRQVEELGQLVADLPEKRAERAKEDTMADAGEEGGPANLSSRFGRYEILRRLGRGGMGQVYLARDTVLGREVALKVPRLDKTDPIVHARFLREARLAAQLAHPNLCTVHDAGVEQGIHFLTMSYIEGELLSDLIREGQRWKPNEAAELVRHLARGLDHAHGKGVIHRDLKPANVMLRSSGEPILMDFGLARQVQSEDQRLTRIGSTMGTPIYMSPEQAKGDRDQTGSGDIYSLGVILYELLTGRVPFEGSNIEVLSKILLESPPLPSTREPAVDSAIEAICLKALAKTIDKRFRSMDEFARALEEYLHIPTVQAEPVPAVLEPSSSPRDAKSRREDRDAQTMVARKAAPETMTAQAPRRKRESDTVLDIAERDRPAPRPARRKASERKGKSPAVPTGLLVGGGLALGGLLIGVVVLFVVLRSGRRNDVKAETRPPVSAAGQPDVKADVAELDAWLLAGKDLASYMKVNGPRRKNVWLQADKEGVVEGPYLLGLYYLANGGTPPDRQEAARLFRKAADRGYAGAQYWLGVCYFRGFGVTKNLPEALAWYHKAAAQGYAEAENSLGFCYDNGVCVEKDFTKAVSWFRKAAEKGNISAQHNLGVKYFRGEGFLKPNYQEAVAWYRKAAEKGFAAAEHKLGGCYEHGTGVAPDPVQAFSWYSKAAAKGYPQAEGSLGRCYCEGRGVNPNHELGIAWIRKAVDKGDPDAKYYLGLLYINGGPGIVQNREEGLRLWKEAAAAGHKKAKDALQKALGKGRVT